MQCFPCAFTPNGFEGRIVTLNQNPEIVKRPHESPPNGIFLCTVDLGYCKQSKRWKITTQASKTLGELRKKHNHFQAKKVDRSQADVLPFLTNDGSPYTSSLKELLTTTELEPYDLKPAFIPSSCGSRISIYHLLLLNRFEPTVTRVKVKR